MIQIRKKTHAEFCIDVEAQTEGTYQMLTEYTGMNTEILVKHIPCGTEYSTTPKNFVRTKLGNCPQCGKTTKKTDEIFIQRVKELVGAEYTFLSTYVNAATKLQVRHNSKKCNYCEYEVKPNDFLTGRRCPKCSYTSLKDHEVFKAEVRELVGDEYKLLSEYEGRHKPIKMFHTKCSEVIEVTPGNFLKGTRCWVCNIDSRRLTKEDINTRLVEQLGNGTKLVSPYVNNKQPVEIYHGECGGTFVGRIDMILQGHQQCDCTPRKCSVGESRIAEYLDKNGIQYSQQKTYEGLAHKQLLRYDFYLPEYELLIEYQGIQHFKPTTFGGISKDKAIANLEQQQSRDELKRAHAKSLGIKLIEPTYKLATYKKIEAYLDREINIVRSNARNP